jgi:RNA polymerase sigma-B factor
MLNAHTHMTRSSSSSRLGSTGLRPVSTEELFRRWNDHKDQAAREQLVALFMPMTRKLARRYHGAREPYDDLLQVACIGLVKAIDRYDPDRGIAFSSFAVPTILGELKRYFRDSGWSVRVPRGTQERAIKVEQAKRRLQGLTGKPPTFQELAQYTEMSVEDVIDATEAAAAHHSVSLDAPREDMDGEVTTLADAIGVIDERFDLVDSGAAVEAAARSLSERERRVLGLRFIADQTQTEIAAEIGVSQMQVSRILRRAIDRLAESVDAG